MNVAKDSTKVIKFMTLFQELRNLIDDEPEGLEALAADDKRIKQLCLDLNWVATSLSTLSIASATSVSPNSSNRSRNSLGIFARLTFRHQHMEVGPTLRSAPPIPQAN